jgi:CRISPR system Cascade subunit CasD
MRCLILRLEAPLMSFGDVAIDEIRPTRTLPGRSLLVGLIGNALGYEHRQVDALDRLQERLCFAARLDRAGEALRDYQTAEIGQDDPLWTTRGAPAKRKGGPQSYSGPVLRFRHYRASAAVAVALTLLPADEAPDLAAVEQALRRPERPLFIGRKCCLPACRVFDRAVEATSFAAALDLVPCQHAEALVETEDDPAEPEGRRGIDIADRRDWRLGFHAGQSRRRELRRTTVTAAP